MTTVNPHAVVDRVINVLKGTGFAADLAAVDATLTAPTTEGIDIFRYEDFAVKQFPVLFVLYQDWTVLDWGHGGKQTVQHSIEVAIGLRNIDAVALKNNRLKYLRALNVTGNGRMRGSGNIMHSYVESGGVGSATFADDDSLIGFCSIKLMVQEYTDTETV